MLRWRGIVSYPGLVVDWWMSCLMIVNPGRLVAYDYQKEY